MNHMAGELFISAEEVWILRSPRSNLLDTDLDFIVQTVNRPHLVIYSLKQDCTCFCVRGVHLYLSHTANLRERSH